MLANVYIKQLRYFTEIHYHQYHQLWKMIHCYLHQNPYLRFISEAEYLRSE
jgi:hypothetical protein